MNHDDAKNKYSHTLNLPQTSFPLRAYAATKEEELRARWKNENLYRAVNNQKKNEHFQFLSGPPYANGHIHLGTAANQILKDIVCKAWRMKGKSVRFKTGWDCHGLPIELKVTQESATTSKPELKKACRAFAQKWIDIQKEEFRSLGILADFEKPYITMSPSYEASTLKAFGELVKKGFIERKNKTVPWCGTCQTVLATVEIEYADRKDPSCYVLFPFAAQTISKLFPDALSSTYKTIGLLVWTTTPWTLPLNRGVVLHPSHDYVFIEGKDGVLLGVGKDVADSLCAILGIEKKVVAELSSLELAGKKVNHPFIEDLEIPILSDESISLTDGTACMHLAPGCGPEDYMIALKNNVEIYSPLSSDGKYTDSIEPEALRGMPIVDGQIWVIKELARRGMLIFKNSIRHSYPHCWRCHNGLMFRATKQWFCSLQKDNLIVQTLKEIETMSFVPQTGKTRLSSTIENRSEWCLSRQRTWGVPITSIICTSCDHAFINEAFIEKIAQGVAQEGTEYWDRLSLADMKKQGIIPSNFSCEQCGNKDETSFKKEEDILDVWFDSGVAHYAIPKEDAAMTSCADLYLEGSDQHRGWFQSSLLTSMILQGKTPAKTIMTHGYVVDGAGKKMSKSLGNVISPAQVIEKWSTDILRLWVATVDFTHDMVISQDLLKSVGESYRRVRNTLRFLISNLYDFDKEKDALAFDDLSLLDQYALEMTKHLCNDMQASYEQYNISDAYRHLVTFCSNFLSSFYLDVIKDRLYVEHAKSKQRRAAQTSCYHILEALTTHMAPVLSFLAEEAYSSYQNKTESIHLQSFFVPVVSGNQKEVWAFLLEVRSAVLKALEMKRTQGEIGHSLDAQVTLFVANPEALVSQHSTLIVDRFTNALRSEKEYQENASILEKLVNQEPGFLKDLFIVSQVTIAKSAQGLEACEIPGVFISVAHASGSKCLRCWQWEVKEGELCSRCSGVLAL